MDFQDGVFNAANDGDLHQLKVFLDGKTREQLSSLVSAQTNGSIPLVMACIHGHLDVALYLVERCHANIEQVGSLIFDGEEIEDASPLWCASAGGHLNIVTMLVMHNASVNGTAEDKSTALSAACIYGHLEVAKFLIQNGADVEIADRHDYTCLMNACYNDHYEISKYLLEYGVQINRKCKQGGTALHACAELGRLEILKMLLKNGANSYCDSSGTTPLLIAAVEGQSHIVEYFIRESICRKQDKINALELLGSFFMKENIDMEKTFEYWKRAMELRYENGEFPLEKPITRSPTASCVDATEVRTLYRLEEMVYDPDEMSIQALLVVERIIGVHHPRTFPYIMFNGERYINNGNFRRCMKLWMYVLGAKLKVQNLLDRNIMILLSSLAELFSCMMVEGSRWWRSLIERRFPPVLFQYILQVFKIYLTKIENDLYAYITEENDDYITEENDDYITEENDDYITEENDDNITEENDDYINDDDDCTSDFHHTLCITLHLVGLMCRLRPYLSKDEGTELRKVVYELVHLNPVGRNDSTLLHLACSNDSSSYWGRFCVINFPSFDVADLLLEVGACPNAVDESKNTPLHVAAMNRPFAPDIFNVLINNRAHLDLRNHERKTPLELAENIPSVDIYPMHYINLQCLCAQAIRKHEIVYKEFVHEKLKEFLDSH